MTSTGSFRENLRQTSGCHRRLHRGDIAVARLSSPLARITLGPAHLESSGRRLPFDLWTIRAITSCFSVSSSEIIVVLTFTREPLPIYPLARMYDETRFTRRVNRIEPDHPQ